MGKPKRYELTAAQWAKIASPLPGKTGDPGRSRSHWCSLLLYFVNAFIRVISFSIAALNSGFDSFRTFANRS